MRQIKQGNLSHGYISLLNNCLENTALSGKSMLFSTFLDAHMLIKTAKLIQTFGMCTCSK